MLGRDAEERGASNTSKTWLSVHSRSGWAARQAAARCPQRWWRMAFPQFEHPRRDRRATSPNVTDMIIDSGWDLLELAKDRMWRDDGTSPLVVIVTTGDLEFYGTTVVDECAKTSPVRQNPAGRRTAAAMRVTVRGVPASKHATRRARGTAGRSC